MVGLIRIALSKYVVSGQIRDCSDAVARLFLIDVMPHIGQALPTPDVFRRNYSYTEAPTLVLEKYKGSLLVLFNSLTEIDKPRGLVSVAVWRSFLRSLHLFEGRLTERDASLCFVWSVMAVADGGSHRGQLKETTLPFEGFLEAICRLAFLVGLPTDQEITALDCSDAGTAWHIIRTSPLHTGLCEKILRSRGRSWGEAELVLKANDEPAPDLPASASIGSDPAGEPWKREPFDRLLEHLVTILLRKVEASEASPDKPISLTQTEMRNWMNANPLRGQGW